MDRTMKLGEVNVRLKQMEVALDTAQIDKQNAETEAVSAKQTAEVSKSEVKQIELMVLIHFYAKKDLI